MTHIPKNVLAVAALGALMSASSVLAQEVINLRPNQVTSGGNYDIGRVRLNYSDISTSGLGQWIKDGTTGLKPTQGIWESFARFHMNHDSDGDGTANFAEFQAMERIYVNVPVLAKERAGFNDLGVAAHVFLVPQINIPEGQLPNAGNASGWDTRPGNYRVHTFPADVEAPGDGSVTAMPAHGTGTVYSFDVTDLMKRWIDQGFVTGSSVFGLGFIPAEPLINNNIALPQQDRLTTFDLVAMSFSSAPLGEVVSSGGAAAPAARLVNISTRGTVSSGEGIIIPGFVVSGGAKQVLVRAVGSELGVFGISAPAADPSIRVVRGSGNAAVEVATNNDWDATIAGRDAVNAASTAAGAFALTAASKSAALTFEAQPDVVHTVIVENAGSSSGVVIVEVYELPDAD